MFQEIGLKALKKSLMTFLLSENTTRTRTSSSVRDSIMIPLSQRNKDMYCFVVLLLILGSLLAAYGK